MYHRFQTFYRLVMSYIRHFRNFIIWTCHTGWPKLFWKNPYIFRKIRTICIIFEKNPYNRYNFWKKQYSPYIFVVEKIRIFFLNPYNQYNFRKKIHTIRTYDILNWVCYTIIYTGSATPFSKLGLLNHILNWVCKTIF